MSVSANWVAVLGGASSYTRDVLGLLEPMGGITADLRRISRAMTSWGSEVVTASDPVKLVNDVCRLVTVQSTAASSGEVQPILDLIAELRPC